MGFSSPSLRAQHVESRSIIYRFNSAEIDTTYKDNLFNTTRLINLITSPGVIIDSVDIYGYASPEGGYRRNTVLSHERAISAKNFLLQHTPDSLALNSSRIRIHAMGENWDGLLKVVENGYFYLNRNEVLRILHKKGLGECTKEKTIRKLDRGYTWHLLKTEFMEDLRTATIITLYTTSRFDISEYLQPQIILPEVNLISSYNAQRLENTVKKDKTKKANEISNETEREKKVEKAKKSEEAEKTEKAEKAEETENTQTTQNSKKSKEVEKSKEQNKTDQTSKVESTPTTEEVENSKSSEKVFLAFKTNMLYDLAMTPNVGVEFHLGKNWSLGANWGYAWWKYDPKALYWRTYGGEIDLRKYFGKQAKARPLSGHHLGIYAQGVTYDFCLGHTGILSDLSYGGGLEYGYSVPVSRTLNIDFGIGVGYLGGEYKVYDPIDNHYVWRETRQRHWFGPTKAEISLVWLIGNKAFRKGGAK